MDSIPSLTATISENGYLLLPGRNMAEILLKKSTQILKTTKTTKRRVIYFCYLHMVVLVNYILSDNFS